ncbi:11834_t:CDS:2, partial [Acaulospora morrowiae]
FIRDFPGVRWYVQKLKGHFFWLKDSIRNIVKERRKEIERTPEDQELTHDLLTMFLTINTPRDVTEKIADSLHDQPMSDEEISGNFLEAVSAGIDTSSNTLCFIVHFLSHYPNVRERLVEEIDRVFGKDPNHQITFEDIGKLKYCEASIRECLRVFSIIPVMFKKNTNPDIVGGLLYPADTQFYINLQGIHKQKSLWSNPEEFNPDRFMDKNNPESKNSLYIFGGGMKKCPGRNLAMLELKTSLSLLYRKYDVELVDMNAPINYYTTAVRTCRELKLRFKKREIWR